MRIVDFHNHLMPAVDDGAQSTSEALAALNDLQRQGVATVVTTPHLDASLTVKQPEFEARMRQLDAAYAELQACALTIGAMRLERGVELALDTPEPDLADARLRLAGGSCFLMEFPGMMVPPRSEQVLRSLSATGLTPVIAHPERYQGMASTLDLAAAWRGAGARLQVNSGSLLGGYGAEVRRLAFELLRRGWVDYLSSDYHARGRAHVAECWALLQGLDAHEQATTLMETNPARLLEGLPPLPVQPLHQRRSLWSRMVAVFGS